MSPSRLTSRLASRSRHELVGAHVAAGAGRAGVAVDVGRRCTDAACCVHTGRSGGQVDVEGAHEEWICADVAAKIVELISRPNVAVLDIENSTPHVQIGPKGVVPPDDGTLDVQCPTAEEDPPGRKSNGADVLGDRRVAQ